MKLQRAGRDLAVWTTQQMPQLLPLWDSDTPGHKEAAVAALEQLSIN